MSVKIKKTLWITGTITVVLVVLASVGYLTLSPRPLKPPETVSSLPSWKPTWRISPGITPILLLIASLDW